jgi:hypothetical protein
LLTIVETRRPDHDPNLAGGSFFVMAAKVVSRVKQPDDRRRFKEAIRLCRVATSDCETLLRRTEEMLRRSKQDNDRHYSD